MPLTSVGKVKKHLGISASDTSQDEFLAQLLSAVEYAFAHLTDRSLELQDYTCFLSGKGGKVLLLPEYPVVSITGVWLDEAGYWGQAPNAFGDATLLTQGVDYALVKDGRDGEAETGRLLKINGVWSGKWVSVAGLLTPQLRPGQGNVRVEYAAGFDPIPDDVQLCLWQTIAQLRAERTSGRPLQSENFEDFGYVNAFEDAKALMMRPGSIQQVVAKYRRIRKRHEVLG